MINILPVLLFSFYRTTFIHILIQSIFCFCYELDLHLGNVSNLLSIFRSPNPHLVNVFWHIIPVNIYHFFRKLYLFKYQGTLKREKKIKIAHKF
jgi:hypothetical protein